MVFCSIKGLILLYVNLATILDQSFSWNFKFQKLSLMISLWIVQGFLVISFMLFSFSFWRGNIVWREIAPTWDCSHILKSVFLYAQNFFFFKFTFNYLIEYIFGYHMNLNRPALGDHDRIQWMQSCIGAIPLEPKYYFQTGMKLVFLYFVMHYLKISIIYLIIIII